MSIFKEVSRVIARDGYVYIGELHQYKQYTGSKARFETGRGDYIVPSYTHQISEFTRLAVQNDFQLVDLNEFCDNHDTTSTPRIITLLLKRIYNEN